MTTSSHTPITYKDAGVDIDAGERAVQLIKASVARTRRPEVVGDLGGFGGLFSIAAAKDMQDPVLVSGTDGVGTKLALAQRFDMHDGVGQDLVAMCANDILALGAAPLFFLDYIAVGSLDPSKVARVVDGIATGCELAGCALIGGEMAEHPQTMGADDYDLSGFCVGIVDRPRALDPSQVGVGDVLIGLASSGVHSNGFSLVRHALTNKMTDDELTAPSSVLGNQSIIEALMAPTRIYVKPVLAALDRFNAGEERGIAALAHITGGGITKNLDRALPPHLDACVTRGAWEVPPIISLVIQSAQLSVDQSYTTFNMGVGAVLICKPAVAPEVLAFMNDQGEQAFVMGITQPGSGKVVYA